MSESTKWFRETAVAGTFYPKDPAQLQSDLRKYLHHDVPKEPAIAVIAPHAGYIYSGKFAGQVYERTQLPRRIVILCPNHSGLGRRISVWARGEWETPLGNVPVDSAFAAKFLAAYPAASEDQAAHEYEHAIEVHLPFLKTCRDDIHVVPITLGPLQLEACERIGQALGRLIAGEPTPTLIVASTDMSHYISAEEAKKQDAFALEAIKQIDAQKLYGAVVEHDISMCGFIPTTVTLAASRTLKAQRSSVLCYGNSGEATNDFKRVVAYAGASIS